MKASREELIDFVKFVQNHTLADLMAPAEYYVERYLKSINSEAGNETPTVTDNEAKKEVCQYCHGTKLVELLDSFGNVVSRKKCPYC